MNDAPELFRRMPKAELHLHLDGSLRPATALELARQRGLDEGLDIDGMAARLVAPARCSDQAELLRAFDLPIAILQDAESLDRVARELVDDVASDGTRYAEIRWAPALHVEGGMSVRDVIRAVVAGVSASRSPARGNAPIVRLIVVAMRSHGPDVTELVARAAAEFVGDTVSGFDLAGPEQAHPDPLAHARGFEIAREAGLGITIHAGEWGGPDQVRRALDLEPTRIAHGAAAAEDASLIGELVARNVTLDLCPSSNVQAGLYDGVAAHPMATLARAGVPVTLSTDDRTVSALTLPLEYERVHRQLGLTFRELWKINRHALDVAFFQADGFELDSLRRDFDVFEGIEPGLFVD